MTVKRTGIARFGAALGTATRAVRVRVAHHGALKSANNSLGRKFADLAIGHGEGPIGFIGKAFASIAFARTGTKLVESQLDFDDEALAAWQQNVDQKVKHTRAAKPGYFYL